MCTDCRQCDCSGCSRDNDSIHLVGFVDAIVFIPDDGADDRAGHARVTPVTAATDSDDDGAAGDRARSGVLVAPPHHAHNRRSRVWRTRPGGAR